MENLTVQVSRSTHGTLREMADRTGETMTEIVDQAVRDYRRRRFWAEYHAAYAAIQADPQAWAELQGEVESWDTTAADGPEDRPDAGEESAGQPVEG